MNNNTAIDVKKHLKQVDLMEPEVDRFDAIMDDLATEKRKRSLWMPMAAMFVLVVGAWLLLPEVETQGQDPMVELINKVNKIEMAVLSQSIKHSEPGSEVLEKMISMENWLVQLNTNIAQSESEQQTLALINAKLEVLDDLVALQNKFKQPVNSQENI